MLLFNITFEVLARAKRKVKNIKKLLRGNEEVRVSFLSDDMILYTNPKRFNQKIPTADKYIKQNSRIQN